MERPKPIVLQLANGMGSRQVFDAREALDYFKWCEQQMRLKDEEIAAWKVHRLRP